MGFLNINPFAWCMQMPIFEVNRQSSRVTLPWFWPAMVTRIWKWQHYGYPRASRSRVAFLPRIVKFMCPSYCPRVRLGLPSCSHRDCFGCLSFFFFVTFGTNFGRNWKFPIRVSIAGQNRSNVTRALLSTLINLKNNLDDIWLKYMTIHTLLIWLMVKLFIDIRIQYKNNIDFKNLILNKAWLV